MQTVEVVLGEKHKAHKAAQHALRIARCDLEKRIHEHDDCAAEGRAANLVQVTLQMIKEQEDLVEVTSTTAKVQPSLHASRHNTDDCPSK